MDVNNEKKWENFLSSIDTHPFIKLPTNKLTITTKRHFNGLAAQFANKLIIAKGGTVKISATQDVLNHYRNLRVSNNQPETPIVAAGDESIDNINEPAGTGARRELFDDREPPVVSDTSDVIIEEQPHINETLTHIVILASDICHVSHDVNIERIRDRDNPTPSTTRADMDKSCSSWSISKIAEYFIFDECVTNIEIPTSFTPYLEKLYKMVRKDIRCRLEIVRGIDLEEITFNSYSNFLRQIISITSIETGSRLLVDALLFPLCSALGLQLEVEKSIDCNFLPNCRFDYCIRKGEHIIGCIEAKSVKGLSSSSVAQAVIQLMILQTTLMHTERSTVDISEIPVFAIVTDGHRFIYMQLKGSSLGFEHNGDKLRIREVGKESDFNFFLQQISFLLKGN